MNKIRQALQEDTAAICPFDQIAQQSEQRLAFIRKAVESGNARVATTDGEVAGHLVLEYTFYAHGFISMLYIHPNHRQKGIGAELLRHAENICTTDKLFTSANESNVSMQALLKKMHFMPSGRIENLDKGDSELVFCKFPEK